MSRADDVSLLGDGSSGFGEATKTYNPSLLEHFPHRHPDTSMWVRLICPEFTSLCPKTGQPDWATLYINYIPGDLCVESKALKLYLNSFRNHGDFHEDVVAVIMKDINELLNPCYIEVCGSFNPRGGIAIYPFANASRPSHATLAESRMDLFPTVPQQQPILR